MDFQERNVLSWLAELMKHRDAADSKRYRMLAKKFIEKYGIDTSGYDVIKGWRANASYFYIAKEFVRDNIDIEILEELLSLGGLGTQYCIKSELAYSKLNEVENELLTVDYDEFNQKYNERDVHSITPKENGFVKLTCEKVYITLSESSVAELGCTSLKANKEYDVSKTKCIDSKGEDQFQTFRDNIGDESDTYIEFSKDSVNYSMINFNRISNSGCSVVVPVVIVCVVVVIVIIIIVVAIVMSKKNKMPKKK